MTLVGAERKFLMLKNVAGISPLDITQILNKMNLLKYHTRFYFAYARCQDSAAMLGGTIEGFIFLECFVLKSFVLKQIHATLIQNMHKV